MYGQASPRSSRHDVGTGLHALSQGPGIQVKGPITAIGVRTNPSAGAVLSPGRSRRHHRAAGGNQGNRSGSPLTLQMDSGYGDMNRSPYLGDTLTTGHSPVPSPGSGRSPYQSPAHSRSSSMTSVKSLLRDRSMERSGERDHLSHHGHHTHHQAGMLIRDRSLDRQLDRHYRDSDGLHPSFGGAKDRSLDREYPHMGARSLDRENHHPIRHGNLVRSRSIDHEYMANQAAFMPSPDLRYARDTLILDLQGSIAELNKECATYQLDLDAVKEKLSSSMNSIKTFWSPELKKERALRKEETSKIGGLSEHLRVFKAQNEKRLLTMRQLEEELSAYKSCHKSGPGDYDSLHKDKQKAAKEIVILRKTIEEMELRIDTQKQTLVAREESIKKLLEMLQSKGLVVKHLEEDRHEAERLQGKVLEEQRRIKQLEGILEQRDHEMAQLKENNMDDMARIPPAHCAKVFIQRDYSEGTLVRFQPKFPQELETKIERVAFEYTVTQLNNMFAEAESLTGRSYCESCFACLTAYLALICMDTQYEKMLKKIARFIQEQNNTVYIPRGLMLIDPVERGLRILEICILTDTSPR